LPLEVGDDDARVVRSGGDGVVAAPNDLDRILAGAEGDAAGAIAVDRDAVGAAASAIL
jgi:hypothetical protein